jgi:hypothetical protein
MLPGECNLIPAGFHGREAGDVFRELSAISPAGISRAHRESSPVPQPEIELFLANPSG